MDGHGSQGNQGMTSRSGNSAASYTAPPEDTARQASRRSNCYGLLALVFRDAPSPQIVAQLRAPPLAEAFSDLGYDAAADLAGDLEAVTDRLREEYTRTFIGPGPHVSLYASVHHKNEGQLWGDSTVRAKCFIEATGLSFEGNWDSIPDHVAIELELMQRLTAHEAELRAGGASVAAPPGEDPDEQLRRCLEVEEKFLLDHLRVWVPKFCDRVSGTSRSLFYREMAKLTKSTVLSDVEWAAAG